MATRGRCRHRDDGTGASRRVEGGCLGGFGFEEGFAPGRDGRRSFLHSSIPHCSQEATVLVFPLTRKVSLQNFPVTVFIVIGFGNSCITVDESCSDFFFFSSETHYEKSRLWLTCVKAWWLKQVRGCFLSHNLKSDRGTGDPRLLW